MILTLTSSGKNRARDIGGKGIEQSILSALDENGPASLEELTHDIGEDLVTVKDTAAQLANNGFVRKEE